MCTFGFVLLCSRALLALVDGEATRSHVDQEKETADDREGLEEVVAKEIAGRMGRVYRPKIVDQDIKDAQQENQEAGAPSCLKTNGDHDACAEAENGDDDAGKRPRTLDDETDEQEDQ